MSDLYIQGLLSIEIRRFNENKIISINEMNDMIIIICLYNSDF